MAAVLKASKSSPLIRSWILAISGFFSASSPNCRSSAWGLVAITLAGEHASDGDGQLEFLGSAEQVASGYAQPDFGSGHGAPLYSLDVADRATFPRAPLRITPICERIRPRCARTTLTQIGRCYARHMHSRRPIRDRCVRARPARSGGSASECSGSDPSGAGPGGTRRRPVAPPVSAAARSGSSIVVDGYWSFVHLLQQVATSSARASSWSIAATSSSLPRSPPPHPGAPDRESQTGWFGDPFLASARNPSRTATDVPWSRRLES